MSDAFRFADDLGPAKVVEIHEPAAGLKAVLVIDNVATGPAIGGVRMAPDASPGPVPASRLGAGEPWIGGMPDARPVTQP